MLLSLIGMAESLDEGEEIISELFPVRESREEDASGTTMSFFAVDDALRMDESEKPATSIELAFVSMMIGDRFPRVIATTDRTLQGWHRGGSSSDADFPGLLGPPSEKGMRRRGKARDPLLFLHCRAGEMPGDKHLFRNRFRSRILSLAKYS